MLWYCTQFFSNNGLPTHPFQTVSVYYVHSATNFRRQRPTICVGQSCSGQRLLQLSRRQTVDGCSTRCRLELPWDKNKILDSIADRSIDVAYYLSLTEATRIVYNYNSGLHKNPIYCSVCPVQCIRLDIGICYTLRQTSSIVGASLNRVLNRLTGSIQVNIIDRLLLERRSLQRLTTRERERERAEQHHIDVMIE